MKYIYYLCNMRTLIKTQAYIEFYNSVSEKVKKKIDYVSNIIIQNKVVNTNFVKKVENTDFYEMRISTGNEYRVILFSIDHENIIESTQILMLNGFIKKSKKDYPPQIEIAKRIIKQLEDESED